ncbi:hypothetical protein [Sphingobium ummariense]|uniref:Uncharacterized protein n=1 Tax=Sphingobium ummariense RL-3 TaxID=1346791 RepID=T0J9R8_9SPHN|nr:hypothetical protein [Sphingobium ummariense]EQB33582.1 hypothetical protein M529_03665 [Sphingobium ummariense RL-3]
MIRLMKDWPNPNDPPGKDWLVHVEFWGLLALSVLGVVMGLGPSIVRLIRSVTG